MSDLFDEFAIDPSQVGIKRGLFAEFGIEPPPPESKGVTGQLRDLGVSALKGTVSVPEAAVGFMDMQTRGRMGKRLEDAGFRPKEAKEIIGGWHTDQFKEQQQAFAEADGVAEKTQVALENPSLIGNAVVESLPLMGAGAVAARGMLRAAPGLAKTKTGTAVAAAAGEGAMMAGSQAEAIRQQTDDGLLTGEQVGASAGTGVLGALFGFAGARLAQKLGIGDVDTLLASGVRPTQVAAELASTPAKSVPRQVIEGAITEGFLEELPQSVSEQILQNLALNKPWSEGVDDAAVMGTLAGMAMGGTAAGYSALSAPTQQPAPQPNPEAEGQGSAEQAPIVTPPNAPAADAGVPPMPAAPLASAAPVAPGPAQPKPSEQMGLDPNAGALSAAAVVAVDSGVAPDAPVRGSLKQAADVAGQIEAGPSWMQDWQDSLGQPSPVVDAQTGEITQAGNDLLAADPSTELQDRLAHIQQQARATGWDARLIAERDKLKAELDALPAAPDAAYMSRVGERAKRIDAAQSAEEIAAVLAEDQADADRHEDASGRLHLAAKARNFNLQQAKEKAATQAPSADQAAVSPETVTAPATAEASIQAVIAKQIPEMSDAEIEQAIAHYGPDHKRTAKLQKEQAKRASQGVENVPQAAQAVEAGPQPAQVASQAPAAAGQDSAAGSEPAGKPANVKAAISKIRAAKQQAKQSEAALEGRDLGEGWTEFHKDSGTVGIPRADMPQIKAEHRGAMVNFLNARGVQHEEQTVPASALKPTQAEFRREKVAKAKAFEGGNRSILISRDGHVLDGHHQWLAARENGDDVKVIRLDAPIRELVKLAHEFPSSTTDDGTGAVPEAAPSKPASVKDGIEQARQAKQQGIEAATNSLSNGQYGATQTLPGKVKGQTEIKQLMRADDGGLYWGDWHTKKHRDLGIIAGGKDKDGTPAYFATKAEAVAAALSLSATASAENNDLPAAGQNQSKAEYDAGAGVQPGARPYDQYDFDRMTDAQLKERLASTLRAEKEDGASDEGTKYKAALTAEIERRRAKTEPNVQAPTPEQVDERKADEYAAQLRKLGDEFQGSYSGRSLAPLARAMADHAIEQGRRLTDAEIADLGKRFDVPADVVEQLTGNIFTFDALLGAAQRREPGAVALRKRQSQAGTSTAAGKPAEYGANNKLVTADRAAELREKLRAKLNGSQLNSGLDPEILAMGTELAIFHLEASARRFAEFARLMADDLGQPIAKIKPYLRMWYNGARDGMEDQGASIEGMDGPDEVRAALAELDGEPAGKAKAAEESDSDRVARIKATPPVDRTDADLDWYADYRQRTRAEAGANKEEAEAAAKLAATSPSLDRYVKDMAPNVAALAIKSLNKQIRIDGKAATLREHIEAWHAAGELSVSTSQEPRIKPMSRRDFNRATNAEQRMHEKRMQEAGSKTVYYVNDYDLGKIAHDYAGALLRDEIEPEQATQAPDEAQSITPEARFERLRSEGHGEMPEVLAFAKVAGATGEKPAEVYNRWQPVMGFMQEVEKGTGKDLASLMGRALVKAPYKVDSAYPGSNPPAVSDLASAQRFAERTAKAMESFNKDMALNDARTFDAERFGVDEALVKAARDAIQQMRQTAAANERAAEQLVKDAEAKEKAEAEAEEQAKKDGYSAADLREFSIKPTAAQVKNWMTGTFQGQTVYSSSGHLIDLSGNEPHLKGWAERMDKLRTTINENAIANVVAGSNVGRAAVKLEPLAINDRPDLKDSKQAVFARKDDDPAVYLSLNYVRYFLSKFKNAEFFAGEPNSRGDYSTLQVRLNGELVGILSPISMKEDTRTPGEIRGFMRASGKDQVQAKSVVERAKAVKAEANGTAEPVMTRDEAEQELARQLLNAWDKQAGDTFTTNTYYPATLNLNGKTRQMAMFRKKAGGALYAVALDTTIYGPVFTTFRVHEGKLIEDGTRNLFAHTDTSREQQVAEFKALFETAGTQQAVEEPAAAGKPESKRSVIAKAADARAKALADYFAPGNVVASYGGTFDRVVSYQAPDKDANWSVTVRAVVKQGGEWVDKPGERERTHMTLPDARELKKGPAFVSPSPAELKAEAQAPAIVINYGGSEQTMKLDAPAYQTTLARVEELANSVGSAKLYAAKHARLIKQAQTAGLEVPDEVLADYAGLIRPDLDDNQQDQMVDDLRNLSGAEFTQAARAWGNDGQVAPASEQATQDAADAFPLKEAAGSYSGISHSGSSRAKADAEEYDRYIEDARASGLAVANTEAQKEAVEKAVTELRSEYLAQYRRLMNVRAGTYSGFVAGRSNINSKQTNQRNNAYDRAIDAFTTWQSANTHKARKAALDARTEAEKAADLAAAQQSRDDKEQKERDADLALMRKILSWKKGGESVAIGKSAVLDGVNKGADGYPTSIKLKPTDGSTLTDDKFDLAALFRNRAKGESVPDSKRRVRELVDAVRAEDASQSVQEEQQAPAKADSKIPLLQAHENAMEKARDGKIDADEFRAAFAQVEQQREAILAELNGMSKDKLLRAGGVNFYHRFKTEKKDRVVDAMYRAMLDEYALGKSYGPTSYMMTAAGMESHRQARAQALRDLVANTDAAALEQYAAEVAEARKEFAVRKEATQKALTDPQTLSEFRSAISYSAEKHNESRREAYLRLTPEQRRRYDELEAESTREAREQAKAKQRTKVASAGDTTAGEVIATKHTKHGHDLFVVKLEERVSREDYETLNNSAKRMGGSYSSYRGNGAIPGFQFRTREAAEAFRKLVAGDTSAAQEVAKARRDAFDDDRSQSAVERLRTMAAALNERADEDLGRDRKVNTARRARMASAAEAAANANKALAGTMNNIADAIESGKAKFLDLVRQKVQVEFLNAELRNAKDVQIRTKYPNYADQVRHRGQPIDAETVDYSAFPTYGGMRSDLAGIARQMVEVDGLKNLGQRLLKVADDVSDAYVEWAKNNLLSVSRFARGEKFAEFTSRDDAERAIRRSGLADRAIVLPLKRGVNRIVLSPSEAMKQGIWQGDDKRIEISGDFGREIIEAIGRRAGSKIKLPWQLETVHLKRKRLEGMGIYTGSEYRAALREFAELQQAMATPDKIKQMERAMVGRRSDGLDFFPTSEAVVDAMLEAAEIEEGMSVLEPSAGMGHIADAVREKTGVEPDVVELSPDRRELLEAKGYNLAGDDFMQMQPRTFYTHGDIFMAADGTKGIMHGGRAWSNRVSLHEVNEDGSEGKMLGWYDRDDLTGIEHRGSWSGYDRIVMNPPFSKGRDILHVQHAYSLLKPGGRLVAIMGEGAFFRSNNDAEGFRAWLDDLGATSERLPENSFMDAELPVNTAVNARMVVIDKPAFDTSTITADSAKRARVRARVAANNYSRDDEAFLQGLLKELYEKTGNSVLEHKLSTWLDSRYQRLEAVDQLYAEHDKAFADKDEVLFSRGPVNVTGATRTVLSHDAVKAIVERVNAGLGLPLPLRIYRSEAELFAAVPEIGQQADKEGAKGQINAVYHDGVIHVVTSALARKAEVELAILDALAHEGQGHYGIRSLFEGDKAEIDTALREFFAAIGGVAGVKRLAAKHGIRDMGLYLETAKSMGERQRAGYLADELLAHLQGKAATAGLTQRAKAAMQAYLGAIREWLRGHGFPSLAKGTDADIAWLLKRMRDAAKIAPSGNKGAPRFSLRPDTRAAYESRIEQLFAGEPAAKRSGATVLDSSDVLALLGYGEKPVRLAEGKVIAGQYNHGLMAEHWKQMPDWLENPVAVFDSETVPGRLVFVAPELVKGQPVVIVIEPNDQDGALDIHMLVNAYDKTGSRLPVARWAEDGLLRYLNKKESPAFSRASGLRLPSRHDQVRGRSGKVFTESDLSKYRSAQGDARFSLRRDQTATEAFRRWFGDSKVVDENGKPLVVYHGTARDFTEFKDSAQGDNFADYDGAFPRDGFWFTTEPNNAFWYANVSANGLEGERAGGGQMTVPVYLSLKNPFRYTLEMAEEDGEAGIPSQLELEAQGYDGIIVEVADDEAASEMPAEAQAMWEKYTPIHGAPVNWPADLRKQYSDLLDVPPKLKYTHYVAFKPTQIKSAIGNIGDFDPENPDIRFSRAGQTESANFRRWFGDSKTLNKDGEPQVLYHGTGAEFTVFDQTRAGSATGHSTSALGIFMSSDRRAAEQYAEKAGDGIPGYGKVMELYASIRNPYLMTVEESQEIENPLQARRLRAKLEQAGHDGIRLKGTPVWIAFNNYQVKSATDNNGEFDDFDPDIRFSRSAVRDMTSRATAELNRTFTAPGGLSWWHKTVGTMYNLAERSRHFKPVFESAQGFIDDVAYYAADAAEMAPGLLPRLETWADIAKKPITSADNKAVSKPIFEGTLMWARDEAGQPVRVDDHNDAGIVWKPAELRAMFGLNDRQIELYQEFRRATDRSLDTMARADMLRFVGEDAKAIQQEVMDAADHREAAGLITEHLQQLAELSPKRFGQLMNAAQGVAERSKRISELKIKGYAPLSRFGSYTVDVVSEDGERQYFGLFETKREANQMAEQMRAEFGEGSVSQGTLSQESYKLFAGITPETLELFGGALGINADGDAAQDQVFQEYLRLTKNNRSAMKRLMHRKGVAGYSEDVGRVLASFVYSNARQTSAGLHMGDLGKAVEAIPKAQGELKDAAVRLAEYIKNPQEEAQAVRGLLFAQYLGGSVASAFVNLTQPASVTFPWLSQFAGASKAAAELAKAARQMATKGYQYEADLAKALHAAEEDGTVSPQEVHQLMAQARGQGSLRAGDGTRAGDARALASNSLARLSVAWGKLFGAAEQVNRRMTFIAAYRVAKEQGMGNPAAFARRAVKETQFVYTKASKMRWGRGAVGGMLMTFKTYSISYLELMGRLWTQGEKGSVQRQEGRKAVLLMLAVLLLMSGAGGLPFADDAEDLIDGLAQLAGYNFSSQKAKEEFLAEVFGEELGRFIDKGVSGIPGAPMDVSGRLGLGNLIPGTGLFQKREDHTRDVLELAGPMGDFAGRVVRGTRSVLEGNVGAGLLEMSPVAVRNAVKGADMAVTGMYRDDKGYKVLDTSTLEAALKSIGFQPESVAKVQEANWLNQRSKAYYNQRAQEIRALWAKGIFERDPDKIQEARDAIARWNAKNPEQRMIINMPSVMRRAREMAKRKDERIAATAPKAMRQQMLEEIRRNQMMEE